MRLTGLRHGRKVTFATLLACVASFAGAWMATAGVARAADSRVYTVGIVPQFTPVAVHRVWHPTLRRVSKMSGYRFEVKSYRNFRAFIDDLRDGVVDFAYLAPFHMTVANNAQGYIPLLRNGSEPLIGVLVVARDSPIQSLADLQGKTIDFPSPQAFAASVLLRADLREHQKLNFTPRYVGTHGNVYRHVVLGQSVAGGGVNLSLAREPAALRDKLRVLYKTEAVPAHPIAVHPRVPPAICKALVDAITALSTEPKGRELLRGIPLTQPVEADYGRDYRFLEERGLMKYFHEDGR